MKLIKEYMCDDRTPSYKEIEEAVNIATTEDCVVKLFWIYPHSGEYKMYVQPNATVEDLKGQLPKRYSV